MDDAVLERVMYSSHESSLAVGGQWLVGEIYEALAGMAAAHLQRMGLRATARWCGRRRNRLTGSPPEGRRSQP